MKVGKWLNALANTSSVTSLPKSPQNIRKSSIMKQKIDTEKNAVISG